MNGEISDKMEDWAADGDVGTREYYKDKCEELYKALREITELDPGLWDTMQKIARKALGMEP